VSTADMRRQGRILAMQALYEADVANRDPTIVLERLVEEERPVPPAAAFARALVRGIAARLPEIDARVASAAPAWPFAQMAKIDKSILRVATFEVTSGSDVPYKAAINEAVEIAKLFGSDSSSRFVNGVLGTIAAQRPDNAAPMDEASGARAEEVPPR
jgi:transcription antitermination protein NusB